MKTSWPHRTRSLISGGPALWLLSLATCGACSSPNDNAATGGSAAVGGQLGSSGGAGGSAAGGSATGGSGFGTGGEGPAGGAPPSGGAQATGGSPGSGGAAGSASGGGGVSNSTGGAPTGGTTGGGDTVTRTAGTYTFQHYPIETDASGVWNGPMTAGSTPTSTTFDTIILENGFLKVTLLPAYGGRVLSIVHKPTNSELLYQNPVGTPYLMNEDIFYYDYLVILGGIFPSFPEPEHGRYWNEPYAVEIVSESPDAVTVRMSRKDDKDPSAGVPEVYDVGRTDILVDLDVTLRAGHSRLELATQLTNTRATTVPAFEYWTVTTLAPGSTPGQTAIPENTRILAQMDQVHLLESSWSWFGSAEERVSGEVFKWNNLAHFENWVDQGTAFANPEYLANWSGLLNEDRAMGVLRVTDNGGTNGLKLWTFGKQSLDIDLADSSEWLRPTIEMWHGVTPEFWMRDTMAAAEVRNWTDSYFPTMGLRDITAASESGAVFLSATPSGTDTVLEATTALTLPGQTVRAVLRLGETVVAEQEVVVAAAEATKVSHTLPSAGVSPGAVFAAEFLQGDKSLLSAELPLP